MLKNIWLNNFVVFETEENFEFRTHGPYIFIGENGSGKSAVFEGIRRCLKADLNTSVSRPYTPKQVSYFMCRFQTVDQVDIICGTVCIPTNKAIQHADPAGTTFTTLETESLDYYQIVSVQKEKKHICAYVDFLRLPATGKGETSIRVHQVKVYNSEGNSLNDLYVKVSTSGNSNNIGSFFLNILNYEHIVIARGHEELTDCQKLLMDLSTQVVFTFPLRSIGPLQWSESNRITGSERENNYNEAEKRCEIIKAFLKEENKDKFDNKIEKRIFKKITNMSKEYIFTLDKATDKLLVNQDQFKLLKTPEGILEAKYVSILLSGKSYKTILLEEPERGMHPQFVQRMTQAIREEAESNGKVVILTTHNTTLLTPWTLSNCYRFSRVGEACSIKSVGQVVHYDLKKLRLMTNDNLPNIFFAKRVLFCEGISDLLFLTEMVSLLLSSDDSNSIYRGNAFLTNLKKDMQKQLSDLTISKMNGKMNTDECRNICRKLCLPCRFLLDKDAKEQQIKKAQRQIVGNSKEESAPGHSDICSKEELDKSKSDRLGQSTKNPDLKPDKKQKAKLRNKLSSEEQCQQTTEQLDDISKILTKEQQDEASEMQQEQTSIEQLDISSGDKQPSDCFFWSHGTIEDMVNIVSQVSKGEANVKKMEPSQIRKKRNKLFLNKNVKIAHVKCCVEKLLKDSMDNDLGNFLNFLLEF